MATSGPGAIHLLNGLYDAKLDHQPVVAIVGQQARAALGGHYQQEVDLASLFKDVARVRADDHGAAQMRHLVDRAVRIAVAERTVTCIIVPNDVQELEPSNAAAQARHGPLRRRLFGARVVPADADLARAAEVLNAGREGRDARRRGALHAATDEIVETADLLGAGVAKALLGKAALPDDCRS